MVGRGRKRENNGGRLSAGRLQALSQALRGLAEKRGDALGPAPALALRPPLQHCDVLGGGGAPRPEPLSGLLWFGWEKRAGSLGGKGVWRAERMTGAVTLLLPFPQQNGGAAFGPEAVRSYPVFAI